MTTKSLIMILSWAAAAAVGPGEALTEPQFTNSLGMKFVRIAPGTFTMGDLNDKGLWNEKPVHSVTVSKPFYMSETEVTLEQFRKFLPDFQGTKVYEPYAAGVSWYAANAFCKWLAVKEARDYRLPTEAEWEYACRAGAADVFSPPVPSRDYDPHDELAVSGPNPWQLRNMHTGIREWCLDWYADYPHSELTDPVGPSNGLLKVVRGGGLDRSYMQYARCPSRAAMAPAFGPLTKSGKEALHQHSTQQLKPGLIGMDYGGASLQNPGRIDELTRVDRKLDARWRSWRWIGYIESPVTASVTFRAEADNGLFLVIDGQNVIEGWGRAAQRKGAIQILRGEKYPVDLYYYQERGDAYLRLYWSWPGKQEGLINVEALSHSPEQREFFESQKPYVAAPGYHAIGFRVVSAPLPDTKPYTVEKPLCRRSVKQNAEMVKHGPDPAKPYFRKRRLLPIPPDITPQGKLKEAIFAAGLHASFMRHNHSPSLVVCPNGDVLAVYYTSVAEYGGDVSLIASRLRFGSDQWDMPGPFMDIPSANDHAPLLWNDNSEIHLFWGGPNLYGGYPFQWCSSKDSCETFGEIHFPRFKGHVGQHCRQPINSAFRDNVGNVYVASDGIGGQSVLWVSPDNFRTWRDTGGRSGARHTTFVPLNDGTILGLGGKHGNIDGFNVKSLSYDGGRTYKLSKSAFPPLGSGQRPTLIRLASGRLFYATDYRNFAFGPEPQSDRQNSLVALSDDQGRTWRMKKLTGAQPHGDTGEITLGYAVARQAPNGVIHLITSLTRPALAFEMNEAWILDAIPEKRADAEPTRSPVKNITNIRTFEESYPDGALKATYGGGLAQNGTFVLHGMETWYYDNGQRQWQVNYDCGRKVKMETYWAPNGAKRWQWRHHDDAGTWTQYWPGGQKKAESTWRNKKCEGTATRWDKTGKIITRKEFVDGDLAD